jgi:DNA polymerase-3 subunit alpha
MQNIDKIVTLAEECRRMQLTLQLPDVNASYFKFTVNTNNAVVYGLGAVKGVGEGLVATIVAAREASSKPFENLFDFCRRVGSKQMNKRALEALIASGALDKLMPNCDRAVLYAAMPDAVKAAEQMERNADAGIMDLFADITDNGFQDDIIANDHEHYMNVQPLALKRRLKGEKDTLGLYVTGHPIDEYDLELAHFLSKRLDQLVAGEENQWLAGILVAKRTMKTKRGKPIAFLTLDDKRARIDVTLLSDNYEKYRDILRLDHLLVIKGELSEDDYSGGLKINAKEILTMSQARTRFAHSVRLYLQTTHIQHKLLQQLQGILQLYQIPEDTSAIPLEIVLSNDTGYGVMHCPVPWRLRGEDNLLQELTNVLGDTNVTVHYPGAKTH